MSDIYVLIMFDYKRWEIYNNNFPPSKKYSKFPITNKRFDNKKDYILKWNDEVYLSLNKEKLKEFAERKLNEKIYKIKSELEYYEDMKIKITKK